MLLYNSLTNLDKPAVVSMIIMNNQVMDSGVKKELSKRIQVRSSVGWYCVGWVLCEEGNVQVSSLLVCGRTVCVPVSVCLCLLYCALVDTILSRIGHSFPLLSKGTASLSFFSHALFDLSNLTSTLSTP